MSGIGRAANAIHPCAVLALRSWWNVLERSYWRNFSSFF